MDTTLDAAAKYVGTYDLIGGVDDNADVNLASADFSVTTESAVSSVPEPSAIFLLLGVTSLTLVLISQKARPG